MDEETQTPKPDRNKGEDRETQTPTKISIKQSLDNMADQVNTKMAQFEADLQATPNTSKRDDTALPPEFVDFKKFVLKSITGLESQVEMLAKDAEKRDKNAGTSGQDAETKPVPIPSRRSDSDDDDEHRFKLVAFGEAAKQYDFAAARPASRKTTEMESIAHLIKCCLGGGVISMHEAYKECGLWAALVLNPILAYCVVHCMHILTRSAQIAYGRTHVPSMSYPDLAQASLDIGPFPRLRKYSKCFRSVKVALPRLLYYYRYLVDATIMLDLFGSCCCYQVIMARSLKQLIESYSSYKYDDSNIRIYIGCLLLPCILICMITTLKYLAPFSMIADIFILIIAAATVYFGSKSAKKSPIEFAILNSFTGLIEYISVCIFSIEGIGAILAIENTLARPQKMFKVLHVGMIVVALIVMIVGFFGFMGFGEASKAPITINFPWSGAALNLKVSLVLMIYITFALNFWIPFDLMWYYLKKHHNPDRYWIIERVYRAVMVMLVTSVALVFPDVVRLMAVIGSFCLANIGFIYPAFIELALIWEEPGLGRFKWRLVKFLAILMFGLILMIVGTISNFNELIKAVYKKGK